MYTQVYDVSAKKSINRPQILEEGRVFVTFVPKGEELYLESDEYKNNEVVFEGTADEAINSLRKLHNNAD